MDKIPGTMDKIPRTMDQIPGTKYQEPYKRDQKYQGPITRDQIPMIIYRGPITRDKIPGSKQTTAHPRNNSNLKEQSAEEEKL